MKLSEIKGEAAIDAMADLLEPISNIISDGEFVKVARDKSKKRFEIVKVLLKTHQKDVIEILASLDGEDPKKYEPNLLTLPVKLLEIFNDKDLVSLFMSQVQKSENESSTPATENIGEKEK